MDSSTATVVRSRFPTGLYDVVAMEIPARGTVVLASDERLVGAVVRAAAAAGVVPLVHREVGAVLPGWATASMVLVGTDLLAEVCALALLRRAQVYVVGLAPPDPETLRDALACGAAAVLELPADEVTLVDLLTDAADGGVAGGRMVGVVGGTGGAGATTFAAALGTVLAAAEGSALLIDADRAGGGIDQVLGLRTGDGVRWDVLAEASGRLSARSLRETLPARGPLSVIAWPADRSAGLGSTTVRSVLSAGRRGYPTVVVDLPRSAPDVLEEVLPRCTQVLVVSTVTVAALAACLHLVERFPHPSTAVVLRGRSGFDDSGVEGVLGLPVWHRMADQRGLDEAVDLGLGPLRSRRGPLARAVHEVVARLDGGGAR